ncbi:hypothetical protein Bca52824_057856 [Brassica carinata]|uniref:Diphthine methyl ester synthase n=1 Tax=Brassica carinata TaxID=52824 RepID=A0A8X7UGL3_BRACI|nr:hypothetical protein Bca52824_057856 [Brassica carinata]
MLYIIGLGLGEESDITMRGLEAVKKSQKIYMDRKRSMIEEAIDNDIAFLVVGESVIPLERYWDLSSAAVMNDVGICRLQLYHYGETVSTPFFTETWRPDSFYEKIKKNRALGLHTPACLISENSMSRRYMTVNTAIQQLLEVEQKRGDSVYSEETEYTFGTMKQLESVDCGAPLHCLVIVGKTHPAEEEMLEFYKYGTAN